jgi:hypothetical protein
VFELSNDLYCSLAIRFHVYKCVINCNPLLSQFCCAMQEVGIEFDYNPLSYMIHHVPLKQIASSVVLPLRGDCLIPEWQDTDIVSKAVWYPIVIHVSDLPSMLSADIHSVAAVISSAVRASFRRSYNSGSHEAIRRKINESR